MHFIWTETNCFLLFIRNLCIFKTLNRIEQSNWKWTFVSSVDKKCSLEDSLVFAILKLKKDDEMCSLLLISKERFDYLIRVLAVVELFFLQILYSQNYIKTLIGIAQWQYSLNKLFTWRLACYIRLDTRFLDAKTQRRDQIDMNHHCC